MDYKWSNPKNKAKQWINSQLNSKMNHCAPHFKTEFYYYRYLVIPHLTTDFMAMGFTTICYILLIMWFNVLRVRVGRILLPNIYLYWILLLLLLSPLEVVFCFMLLLLMLLLFSLVMEMFMTIILIVALQLLYKKLRWWFIVLYFLYM